MVKSFVQKLIPFPFEQVSQCYQAVSLFIIVKEQCIIGYGCFPTSVFYFYELVIKIQIRTESRNWDILSHACPPGA